MVDRKVFCLNDEFIAQLQNLVTYCIVTGTNIVDNLRQIRLEESSENKNTLVLTPEYLKYHEDVMKKLATEVEKLNASMSTLSDSSESEDLPNSN